jgi:TonB family protein
MNTEFVLRNLLLWTAQTTLILAATSALALLIKTALPKTRLAFWQLALIACLLLPALAPWQQEVATSLTLTRIVTPTQTAAATAAAPAPTLPGPWEMLAIVLAFGILVRFTLLIAGLYRLRQYRRRARPFLEGPIWSVEAELLTSDEVKSPVTFGFIDPVILLPAHFSTLDSALRETVIFHEILHVRRKDWLFAVAEESVRAVFWFHPAFWYAIREIRLAREEAVDREVVETMDARQTYVDALLAIAATPLGVELAPAPFFLRRKHLKRRIVSIFQEVTMSKRKSASALLAGCFMLGLSCWLVTGALPLKAQPQAVIDGPGVTVDTNGARLMHRSAMGYPTDLIDKHVEGTVTAQVRTDGSGNVIDATITAGPDELRRYVLQSVLTWHFTSDAANSTRIVNVAFSAPKEPVAAPVNPTVAAIFNAIPASNRTLSAINVGGLPDAQRDELLAKLPAHVGDTWTPELRASVLKAVSAYDEHMRVNTTFGRGSDNGASLYISAPMAQSAVPVVAPAASATPAPLRVGGNVAAQNLINQPPPVYPPLAKTARVQGTVKFEATVGKDGTIQNLHLISGPPLLVQAAMQAVQQWTYRPTLLNGQPVEVITTIDVNFTLAQDGN